MKIPESHAQPFRVGVVGAASCSEETYDAAYVIGKNIAGLSAVLICGGLGGVMEGAAKGACEQGGLTIGILPSSNPGDANPYITFPLPTGLGHARNILIIQASQAVVAISGETGTPSEIAIALKIGVPVIGYQTWKIDKRIKHIRLPEEIVPHLERIKRHL
jgi:uncharacterized protein (TIGR00725 family)